jgi:hypothetical protein
MQFRRARRLSSASTTSQGDIDFPEVDLPLRQKTKGYREPEYAYNRVPDKY